MFGKTLRVHFVGIGGSGMNGIAELLANLGHIVSGSDLHKTEVTDRLLRHGITVFEGHSAGNVGGADVVVRSSAVPCDNPELLEAERRGIPVIARAEMLAELMRLRYGIAVAGSHGKTTTTSMIAFVLESAGLDPTAVIGGRLSAFGGHARLGRGDCMVVEADESDRSFLKLSPAIAVITNVDEEHLENYGSFDKLQEAFVEFANKVPFYGAVVAVVDDPVLGRLVGRMKRRVITCGIDSPGAHYAAEPSDAQDAWKIVARRPARSDASGRRNETALGDLSLSVPGRHNVLNALATVAVCLDLGVPFDRIAGALSSFQGAERRFQRLGEEDGVLVVDDYGHHPTEIAAVVRTARSTLQRPLVVVFQPHRYTRTAQLMDRFGEALSGADEIVLTDIYPAGEPPIPGVTVERLRSAIERTVGRQVKLIGSFEDLPRAVARLCRRGDAVITLGAGSIGRVGPRILQALREAGAGGER
ncbi:MAG: UDP-N-acetylmuramate--L-alanine ligase [Vicinamibacterales bacterium]